MIRWVAGVAVLAIFLAPAIADGPPPFAAFDLASEAVLNDPHDLAIGPDGRLYVADKHAARIAVFDAETLVLEEILFDGFLPGVHDISFGPDGRAVISVTNAGMVVVFDQLIKGAEPAQLLAAPRAEGALAHSNGRTYAMASGIGVLIAFEGAEIAGTAAGHPGAHDVAEDREGNIWVADNANRRLVKYSPDLQQQQIVNHPKFAFAGPRYLDVDEFGRLVVADQEAHRILLIDPDGPDGGTLIGVLGDGAPGIGPNKFDDPEGVAVAGGRFYFADSDNNRIVRYSIVVN